MSDLTFNIEGNTRSYSVVDNTGPSGQIRTYEELTLGDPNDFGGGDLTNVGNLYLSGGAYLGGTAPNNLLSALDRQSFTPVFTNLTIGNGTLWGYYQTINDVCYAIAGFVMGSTSSVGGTLKLTGLPEISSANTGNYYPAQISMIDSGSAFYGGHSMVNASATITQSFYDFSNAVLNGTNPFTWTTNDSLTFKTSYPIY